MLEAKLSKVSSYLKMGPQVSLIYTHIFKMTFRLCSQTMELGRRTTGPKTAGGEVQRRRWRRADKVIFFMIRMIKVILMIMMRRGGGTEEDVAARR